MVGGAERLRGAPAVGARLADPHRIDGARVRGRDREQPVGARADDEQRVTGAQAGAIERAQHAAERLDERPRDRVQVAERQELADERRAQPHPLGEAARIQRGGTELVAQRLVAAPAAPALAARHVVVDHDAIPGATPRTPLPVSSTSPTTS